MKNELVQAIIELKQAEQNFQYADKEFIEIAILQLKAAECKANTLLNLKTKKKADSSRENPPKVDWLKKLTIDIVPQKIEINFVNLGSNREKRLTVIGKNF